MNILAGFYLYLARFNGFLHVQRQRQYASLHMSFHVFPVDRLIEREDLMEIARSPLSQHIVLLFRFLWARSMDNELIVLYPDIHILFVHARHIEPQHYFAVLLPAHITDGPYASCGIGFFSRHLTTSLFRNIHFDLLRFDFLAFGKLNPQHSVGKLRGDLLGIYSLWQRQRALKAAFPLFLPVNLGFFSDLGKLYMTALMWIGRLEVLSVLVIFTPSFWTR